ncbi:WHG domain-containing protein [Microbacterium sp. EYE_5]|nr:WHG domain-containing protein [Microbacterium sp. EYE_382]MCK6085317.1 WHG domain-containing protein [Microbacterium sp. EYE_384]MCK6122458.1 WHG domain-containing protein [Microbacterium sp. EYE_80]MCK6126080.1 WHG domain-containing protein [Microbacterium sp. EYE_79]MCK6141001.1 WHG domain-containing protein [Microbacterium sp. EYE_39]MCK6217727.1 WHG domain-containing protein [Microbacterium sp. EYE_5]MCK6226789.1 WHG domain-containing protein [Microbacterium sp. EYE_77]MCK6245873.1 WH
MPRVGLDARTVTEAGADLADEIGLERLSMSLVAERLGVKPPSLYKHVDSLATLIHRIAVLGADDMADELRDALQGVSGREAVAAAAHAFRRYVREHPGRYGATTGARPRGPEDALAAALQRTLTSLEAVLHDYRLDPAESIHALRMLRSILHGFATLEAAGGFQIRTDVDESVDWVVDFIDRGLRTPARH